MVYSFCNFVGWVDIHHLLEKLTTRLLWTLIDVTMTLMMKCGRTSRKKPEILSRNSLSLTRGSKPYKFIVHRFIKRHSDIWHCSNNYKHVSMWWSSLFSKRMTIFDALDHPWLNVSLTCISFVYFQLLVIHFIYM